MSPKRLRTIAYIVRREVKDWRSADAIAKELEAHATELESAQLDAPKPTTVIQDIAAQAGRKH